MRQQKTTTSYVFVLSLSGECAGETRGVALAFCSRFSLQLSQQPCELFVVHWMHFVSALLLHLINSCVRSRVLSLKNQSHCYTRAFFIEICELVQPVQLCHLASCCLKWTLLNSFHVRQFLVLVVRSLCRRPTSYNSSASVVATWWLRLCAHCDIIQPVVPLLHQTKPPGYVWVQLPPSSWRSCPDKMLLPISNPAQVPQACRHCVRFISVVDKITLWIAFKKGKKIPAFPLKPVLA